MIIWAVSDTGDKILLIPIRTNISQFIFTMVEGEEEMNLLLLFFLCLRQSSNA